MTPRQLRPPRLGEALIPVGVTVASLDTGAGRLGSDLHPPSSSARWSDLEQGLEAGFAVAIPACLILLVVGLLIGTRVGGVSRPPINRKSSKFILSTSPGLGYTARKRVSKPKDAALFGWK